MTRFLVVCLLFLGFSNRSLLANAVIFGGPTDTQISSFSSTDLGQASTIGQSFIAVGPILQSISLNFARVDHEPLNFQLYVYAWQLQNPITGHTTGNALYTSQIDSVGALEADVPLTFTNLNVPLTVGGDYIFLLSTIGDGGSGDADISGASADYGYLCGCSASDFYSGGMAFYSDDGDGNPSATVGQLNWAPLPTNLAFTADFSGVPSSATPEPSSLMLLGTGTMALFSQRKRFGIK